MHDILILRPKEACFLLVGVRADHIDIEPERLGQIVFCIMEGIGYRILSGNLGRFGFVSHVQLSRRGLAALAAFDFDVRQLESFRLLVRAPDKNKKSRRSKTPESISPRRLTHYQAPRYEPGCYVSSHPTFFLDKAVANLATTSPSN